MNRRIFSVKTTFQSLQRMANLVKANANEKKILCGLSPHFVHILCMWYLYIDFSSIVCMHCALWKVYGNPDGTPCSMELKFSIPTVNIRKNSVVNLVWASLCVCERERELLLFGWGLPPNCNLDHLHWTKKNCRQSKMICGPMCLIYCGKCHRHRMQTKKKYRKTSRSWKVCRFD